MTDEYFDMAARVNENMRRLEQQRDDMRKSADKWRGRASVAEHTLNRIKTIYSAGLEVGGGPNMLYTDPEATLDKIWDALNGIGGKS